MRKVIYLIGLMSVELHPRHKPALLHDRQHYVGSENKVKSNSLSCFAKLISLTIIQFTQC